jgi:formylglycine-generating enzyme required for sulfatase activity
MRSILPLLFTLVNLPLPGTAAPVVIDTVPIRDSGNAPDISGFGRVDYDYRIGKFEVTIGQYVDFLNAVAATDTHSLYSSGMTYQVTVAGVSRSGSPGNYSYATIGSPNRPITFVSWFEAARFANWMSNGQPSGMQDSTTTEDGAYTLTAPYDHVGFYKNAINPNTGRPPLWWIPSEDEWYKAAHYNPARNFGGGGYHAYPIQSDHDSIPYSVVPPGTASPNKAITGNFNNDDGSANGYSDGYAMTGSTVFPSSNALSDVGAYSHAPTYYGTYDQGGNVFEITDGVFVSGGLYCRSGRGGSWFDGPFVMHSSYRLDLLPQTRAVGIGFRLATQERSAQRIRFATPRRANLVTGRRFDLSVSSTSGLPVTVRSSDRLALSVRGISAHARLSGRVTLTARQPGDEYFLPAQPVTKRVRIR